MMSTMQTRRIAVENSADQQVRGRLLVWAIAAVLTAVAIVSAWAVGNRPSGTGIANLAVVYLDLPSASSGAGRPYVLDLELEKDGYPLILHLDADGLPSILFPIGAPTRLSAGRKVRLPDPSGSATWWTAPGESAGTLMVAIETASPQSAERLLELAERAASRAPDAESAKESVRRVLRDRLGPAVVAELGTRH